MTYPLDLPSLQVTIASVDVTAYVLARTLVTHAVLGPQVDSCAFGLKAPESYRAGSLTKPSVGQSVQVLIKTSPSASFSPIYTGIISRVGEVKMAYKTVRWNIECVDNTHLLTRLLVVQNYQNQLVSDIVLDIAKKYCGGIDTSGVQVTHGRTVQSITFSYKSPLDCFEELAGLVQYQWFVDPANILYFYDPSSTLRVASQSITDTSNNFDELTIEPQLDQVRNRVYVTGGMGLSATVVETFPCDGRRDTFTLQHRNIISPNLGMQRDGKLGDFMTLSGSSYGGAAVNQLTAVASIGDASLLPSGWLVDVENAIVGRSVGTPIPPDETLATFRYQYKVPVNVVQQDIASMQAVAALDGSDWVTTVSGDNPLHWWRLNETSGTEAHNRGPSVQLSGVYSGGYTQGVVGPVINDPTSFATEFDGVSGKVNAVSGVRFYANYAIEALVQTPLSLTATAPIWTYVAPYTAEGTELVIDTGQYLLVHYDSSTTPHLLRAPINASIGRYDHVVAQYVTGSGALYINNQLAAGPTALFGPNFTGTNARFSMAAYGNLTIPIQSPQLRSRMAEVVIYSGGLSATQIGEHYFAFKYGGIREHALTINGETSYDACMQLANAELDRYSAVITKLTWNSFVPPWQVGDTVTVNVTSTNLGRTFSGTALIQEVVMRWLGAQRFRYEVMCQSVRYNPLDHARALAAPRDPIVPNSTVAGLVLMTTFTEDDAIVIDGPVTHTIA